MCALSCLLPDGDSLWGSIFQESWNQGTPPTLQPDRSSSFDSHPTPTGTTDSSGGHGFKKLNHNASERHRRKKINSLYSSLRSLLPPADQSSRKLSIPNTVDRVVKYIPELQNEVERLARKKEELSSRSRDRDVEDERRWPAKRNCNRRINHDDLPAVSATRLGDDQIAIQICEHPSSSALSCILDCMEEDGFSLLNLSSFQSSPSTTPTVFYHLHFLQMNRSGQVVEAQDVRSKLLSLYYHDKAPK